MQQVLKDSTHALKFYPPREIEGRVPGVPSSGLIRIGTGAVSLPAVGSEDAATISSVSGTTNADAAEGATSLAFASDPTVTAGDLYLLENTIGERCWVRASKTGSTVYLSTPIPFAAASGSTLKGIAITHALTAAETANYGEGIAFLAATMDGVQRTWSERFEVVRSIFTIPLSATELIERRPEVLRLRSSLEQGFDEIIKSAWLDVLRPELNSRGFHDERIRSPDAVVPPLLDAVVYKLSQSAYPTDIALLQRREQEFIESVKRMIGSAKFWYDQDSDSVDLVQERTASPVGFSWMVR